MRKSKKFGFTLLELLVVISIIGILIALGAVAYSTAQKKGRDARRTGDMKAVQAATEQYYANTGSNYPTANTQLLFTYLNSIPVDPKTGDANYVYSWDMDQIDSYCVCAKLENTSGGNSNSAACGFVASGGTHFCVKNQQ